MNPLVFASAIIVLPVVVLLVLRVNATLVFLSLCLGAVLMQFVSADAASFVGIFSGDKTPTHAWLSMVLLFLPAVFTTLVMIRTAPKGAPAKLINLLPALAVGVMSLLLVEPLLSENLRTSIQQTALWAELQQGKSFIVGASTLVSLLVLWMQRRKPNDARSHH